MDSAASKEYRPLLNQQNQNHCPGYINGLSSLSLAAGSSGDGGTFQTSAKYRASKSWPWFLWLLLKIVGLYNYRRIVTRRRCHLCRLAVLERRNRVRGEETSWCDLYLGAMGGQGRDVDDKENESNDSHLLVDVNLNAVAGEDGQGTAGDGDCVVCRSEWCDVRGRYRPYSETDIGARKWNHFGSTVLSVIWPLTLIALIVYDFFFYLRNYWGKEKHLIRLISYSTFLLFNASSPLFSLVANVRNLVLDRRGAGWRRGFSWYEALGVRYIVKRFQHLELSDRGLPYKAYLAVCLLWPCVNGAYRAVIYFVLVHHSTTDAHIEISLAAGLVNMIVWGAFCYLILLMRISFQRQLRLELAFLWRHAGALDVCRRRLAVYAEELGSMCRLVSIWIIVVIALSTWAFTTQICWDYLVISNNMQFAHAVVELHINIMIWSENTMFLILPLVAVGGMDLNGVWVRFERDVSQMRSEAQEAFWDKILAFCKEQTPVYKVEMLTLMFSALGIFLGLHFGDQNVDYWVKHQRNVTDIYPAMK